MCTLTLCYFSDKIFLVLCRKVSNMKTNKDKIFSVFCITTLAAAFVYGLVLPFCWGNNPLSETGTLSLLCEHRQGFFWVWGLLTCGSIALNTEYMYKKFMYKNKFFDILCIKSYTSACQKSPYPEKALSVLT